MDYLEILKYALIGASSVLVTSLLKKGASKEVSPLPSGEYRLQMPNTYRIMGIVFIVCGPLMTSLLFLVGEVTLPLIAVVGGFGVLISLFGVACMVYVKRHYVAFDANEITAVDGYGNKNTINWSDITDMKASPLSGKLKIKSANKSLKAHLHLEGLKSFLKQIEKHTDWSATRLKIPMK